MAARRDRSTRFFLGKSRKRRSLSKSPSRCAHLASLAARLSPSTFPEDTDRRIRNAILSRFYQFHRISAGSRPDRRDIPADVLRAGAARSRRNAPSDRDSLVEIPVQESVRADHLPGEWGG